MKGARFANMTWVMFAVRVADRSEAEAPSPSDRIPNGSSFIDKGKMRFYSLPMIFFQMDGKDGPNFNFVEINKHWE